MPISVNKGTFTKVEAVRELLREKAEEIVREYLDIAAQAKASGDYMTAAKAMQWLIEHMPRDMDGQGIVSRSVDKDAVVQQTGNKPNVKIGIQLGGVTPKQLKGTVIDAIKPTPVVRVAAISEHNDPDTE